MELEICIVSAEVCRHKSNYSLSHTWT